MATHTYRAYDRTTGAAVSPAFPGILAAVPLEGVATTSGSNIITVTSTAGLWPFMGLSVPNIPRGAFILAVKSATELVAAAPLYNAELGTWSVTEANANATANGSSMTGHAHGFNPTPIPEVIADGSTYRNQFPLTYKNSSADVTIGSGATDYASFAAISGGYIIKPETDLTFADVNGSKKLVVAATDLKIVVSDDLAATPPRPYPKSVSYHYLVATEGMINKIPSSPDIEIIRTA